MKKQSIDIDREDKVSKAVKDFERAMRNATPEELKRQHKRLAEEMGL